MRPKVAALVSLWNRVFVTALMAALAACGGSGSSKSNTSPPTYTVGGAIVGLTASGLVLQDNGGDNLAVPANATTFTFATALANGAAYNVTVLTQPTGQTCTVSGGSGTVGSAIATNVSVTCATATLSVHVSNLLNKGVVHSGFVVGTATAGINPLSSVQVSIDGGALVSATGTTSWSFKLPSGGSTWKENSAHTLSVKALDTAAISSPAVTLSVRKGVNQDVNGDGYADVVVGAAIANSGAGAAYVFLSAGATGVPSGGYSAANTTLSGPGGGGFGQSVALGDVNGDGYADVVVGANLTNSSAGAVYVFFSAGATGVPSAASSAANTALTGAVAGGLFGSSVALGDVNGDGYADLVVGAPHANGNINGAAYVFLSAGAAGVPSAASSAANTTLSGGTYSEFGQSVAAGDVNGDGYADVVVGAFNVDGAVYVFHSAGAAGVPSGAYSAANTTLSGAGDNDSNFGASVAVGDVNGDGYADVVVGMPYAGSVPSVSNGPGAAYVFHSAGAAGVPSVAYSAANTTLTGPATSLFGNSVATGDVNGDGYADVVVGAFLANGNAGAAYVFHSAGAAGVPSAASSAANTTLTGPATSLFGGSVATGDVNGDGYADVVVGAYRANSTAGTAYVFHSAGAAGVPSAASSAANTTLTGPASSYFGYSVALTDPIAAPGAPLLAAVVRRRQWGAGELEWG